MKKLRSQPWVTLNHASKAKGFNFEGNYPVRHPSKPLYGSISFDKDGCVWLGTNIRLFHAADLSKPIQPSGHNTKSDTGWEGRKYGSLLVLSESVLAQMIGVQP